MVSNLGRVKRVKSGRIKRPQLGTTGYYAVTLSFNGKPKIYRIHTLVAYAFLGARPDGAEINHKDGNKLNNCADNLEYCTRSENIKHAYAHGLMKKSPGNPEFLIHGLKGEKHPYAKLNQSQVDEIRERRRVCPEIKLSALALEYKVSRSAISDIVRGKNWKHSLK